MQHLPTELWKWDAADLARAIRARAVSSREATEACLARLMVVNPRLNAVVEVLEQDALAAADAADAAVAAGAPLGMLHGVPVTTKENVDQAGLATPNGIVAFRDLIAKEDSPVVANLKKAGAILFGRTNTPAFSWRWFTENDLHGRTLNPWSQAHTPGGSSGGASAAVAAGIGPIAHGNDIGGSVRYPAYCTGLVGMRPSFGRVPAFNPSAAEERPLSAQLFSVQGPLTRSVRDNRLALAAMAQRDVRDPWWVPAPLQGPPLPRPIKVGLCADPTGDGVHPAVAAAVERAGRLLEDVGYVVEPITLPGVLEIQALWNAFAGVESRVLSGGAMEKYADKNLLRSLALQRPPEAPPLPTLETFMRTTTLRSTWVRRWALLMESYPLIVCPVSAEPPFLWGADTESRTSVTRLMRAQAIQFVPPTLGMPGLAVPTGLADGLPMGVQILAQRFREDLAYDAAEIIEANCPMPTPIDPRF